MTDNRTLYVYYKIPANQSASCLLAVKQLHQDIALRYPNVVMQRQKRPEPDATNQETWMEIYDGIAPMQLEPLMADLITLSETYDLPRERRTEVFIHL